MTTEGSAEASSRRAAAVAGHLGDASTARSLAAHDDESVRATAFGALARLGSLTDTDLASILADTSAEVRRRSAEWVIQQKMPATVAHKHLIVLMTDRDAMCVETACWAIGELTPPEAESTAAVIRATEHTDPLVREAAVAALGAVGDQAGLEAILRCTTDKPAIRRRAILALAPFEGNEVEAALRTATQDRDWQVRQAAEDLLA